ncbi:hypothetical protein HAX54_029231 [Datura stramonium]|uniref:Uncharacterized protein n=1 Tax=Datura stramonium TaxID=4076 RepID=A0ABS8SA59_DATST|nr:hypothetical protein [Datura stramonium]
MDFFSSLANISSFKELSLSVNNIGGQLPKNIGNFSANFRSIGFARNKLFGRIPDGFVDLSNMEVVSLEYNQLTGEIPVSLEYGMTSEVSTYGDIYSYGIIILELLTGKKPTDDAFSNGMNLHNYAKMAFSAGRVMEIVDPMLFHNLQQEETSNSTIGKRKTKDYIKECSISMCKIGIACTMDSPKERMGISEFARLIHEVVPLIVLYLSILLFLARTFLLWVFCSSWGSEDSKGMLSLSNILPTVSAHRRSSFASTSLAQRSALFGAMVKNQTFLFLSSQQAQNRSVILSSRASLEAVQNSPSGSAVHGLSETVVGVLGGGQLGRMLCGVLTVEIEHVDVATLEKLEQQGVDCQPKASTIRIIQDKYLQKVHFSSHSIPLPKFMQLLCRGARRAGDLFGYPLMIKSRRLAYDGRGKCCC